MQQWTSEFNVDVPELIKELGHSPGGPAGAFERVGRHTFDVLANNGLKPHHKLLDYGCGALRLGYWFIRYLDCGHYYGIQPIKSNVDVGIKFCLTPELLESKKPAFSYVETCDMGAFGETFDYAVARSIFTHMTPGMLRKSLETFRRWSHPDAMLFATYYQSEGAHARIRPKPNPKHPHLMQPHEVGDHLPNDDWRFINVVKYSFPYLDRTAKELGLKAEEIDADVQNHQVWMRFTHEVGLKPRQN